MLNTSRFPFFSRFLFALAHNLLLPIFPYRSIALDAYLVFII